MEQIGIGTWLNLITTIASIGIFAGIVLTKLKVLEKKQDKHNKLVKRIYTTEQSAKSAHKRIDEIPEHIEDQTANQISTAMKDFRKERSKNGSGN